MPNDPMEYEVINDEIKQLLRDLGGRIRQDMPPGFGFALHIFTYGEGGAMFYVSSANREDYVKAMKEFVAKFGEKEIDS